MELSSNYPFNYQENRIPRNTYLLENNTGSNYRRGRENFLNSINNNISTSLSSYDKINEKNNNYLIQHTQENNILNSTKNRSRSRSPCFCGCHSNDESAYIPEYHLIPIYHRNQYQTHSQYTNSLISKNEEMNKKNDDLLNEIIYLKRNLKKVENELNRTKNEKDASDFYIKELEKELSRLNISNQLNDPKKRMINSVKMRDFGRYHDMLNKSFEVLDSVSNQCNDERGKTKGGVNYYFDKKKDYNQVIDTQKKWLDNLPNNLNKNFYNPNNDVKNMYGTLNKRDNFNSNNFINEEFPDNNSRLNEFKNNINNYNNINEENNNEMTQFEDTKNSIPKRDNSIPSNYSLNYDKGNNKRNISPNSNYPNQIKQKMNSLINNKNNNNSSKYEMDKSPGTNISKSNPNEKEYRKTNSQNNSYNPDNKNKIENKNSPNKNDRINNNKYKKIGKNDNENQEKKNDNLYKRYLIVDKDGNPIFIEGNRLLGMEIIPIIGKDGKEELDENGNIIFLGPDGEPKTQDDLEPIILDNDLPLVNNENKPFLGINGVALVNRYGNPIVGPGELYDKDNKVVHGELGILPTDKQGNLIKLNINGDPLEEENGDNYNNVPNENNSKNENNNNIEDNNHNNDFNKDDDNNEDNNKNINNDYKNDNGENEGNNYKYGDDDEEGNNNNYNFYNDTDNDNNNNFNNEDNNYNKNANNLDGIKNKINNKKYNQINGNKKKDKPFDNYKINKLYDNYKINKPYDNNYNDNQPDNNNYGNLKIKPLIGSDGRPVIDKKNNPIMLDENNRPVKGTGINILLDQAGKPILNSIGEPILINKDGKPINLIDEKNNDNKISKISYPFLNKNYKKNERRNNKKKQKNDNNNNNDNKETGRFNINPFNDGKNKEYIYPKPNPNYQRKINYKPIRDTNYNPKEYASSCFACDVGCSVSRSGYSPMTYSPFDNKLKRREVTPLKDQI